MPLVLSDSRATAQRYTSVRAASAISDVVPPAQPWAASIVIALHPFPLPYAPGPPEASPPSRAHPFSGCAPSVYLVCPLALFIARVAHVMESRAAQQDYPHMCVYHGRSLHTYVDLLIFQCKGDSKHLAESAHRALPRPWVHLQVISAPPPPSTSVSRS